MFFTIVGDISDVEPIAIGKGIREGVDYERCTAGAVGGR
jgi:hypothetical protein